MSSLTLHPLTALFPSMEGDAFADLVADIRANGVNEPISLYQGQILDGRNRYRASIEAGRHCPTRLYEGNNPLSFVISQNLRRRHLDESQRAMIAARLANLLQGQRHDRVEGSIDLSTAATLLNVVKRASSVPGPFKTKALLSLLLRSIVVILRSRPRPAQQNLRSQSSGRLSNARWLAGPAALRRSNKYCAVTARPIPRKRILRRRGREHA